MGGKRMKSKTSVKMSEKNITFWKRLNVNCIKSDATKDILSYSDLQERIVAFFKIYNDKYLDLIKFIKETKENGDK